MVNHMGHAESEVHDPVTAPTLPATTASTATGAATRAESAASEGSGGSWTFLSNHAHVLLCLAADPDQTLPAIAEQVGITSRAVQLILGDLIDGGYVERTKVGRRNHYHINPDGPLRHPLEAHHSIAELIAALGPQPVTPAPNRLVRQVPRH